MGWGCTGIMKTGFSELDILALTLTLRVVARVTWRPFLSALDSLLWVTMTGSRSIEVSLPMSPSILCQHCVGAIYSLRLLAADVMVTLTLRKGQSPGRGKVEDSNHILPTETGHPVPLGLRKWAGASRRALSLATGCHLRGQRPLEDGAIPSLAG
jgi:hypothetical protein